MVRPLSRQLTTRRASKPVDGAWDVAILAEDGEIVAECFGRSSQTTFHDAQAYAELFASAPRLQEELAALRESHALLVRACEWAATRSPGEKVPEAYQQALDRPASLLEAKATVTKLCTGCGEEERVVHLASIGYASRLCFDCQELVERVLTAFTDLE